MSLNPSPGKCTSRCCVMSRDNVWIKCLRWGIGFGHGGHVGCAWSVLRLFVHFNSPFAWVYVFCCAPIADMCISSTTSAKHPAIVYFSKGKRSKIRVCLKDPRTQVRRSQSLLGSLLRLERLVHFHLVLYSFYLPSKLLLFVIFSIPHDVSISLSTSNALFLI